jgi:hypothetical protein
LRKPCPLLWLSILWVISCSGWRRFAAGRECPEPPPGVSVNALHTLFGGLASYNNATIATFTEDGFHLRVRRILSVFHPAFFVPWDLVTSCKEKVFFIVPIVEFSITDGTTAFRVRLSRRAYRRVSALLPERLQCGEVNG